jgi:hypothetical protein
MEAQIDLSKTKIVEQVVKKNSELWGGTTNLREHDPNKFRYLIHAFNPHSQKLGSLFNDYSAKQAVDLMRDPERLAERESLSMSLIDQEHSNTWGSAGLIVKAPVSNVIITNPTDLGAPNSDKASLLDIAKEKQKLTPDELLASTPENKYNEVVALGTEGEGILKLEGFFIVIDADGDSSDEETSNRVRSLAEKSDKPLVEISYGQYQKEQVIQTPEELFCDYQGKRVTLETRDEFAAFLVQTGAKSYIASNEEMLETLNHFVETGNISIEKAADIADKYTKFKILKLMPNVAKDGQDYYISLKTSLGKKYSEYHFRAGVIFRIDVLGSSKVTVKIDRSEMFQAVEKQREWMSDDIFQTITAQINR